MSRFSGQEKLASKVAMGSPHSRRWRFALCALALLSVAVTPAFAKRSVAQKKQLAHTYFDTAEQMRTELDGRPVAQKKERDYARVIDAYRKVYYIAPTSVKADPAVNAVGELLLEQARAFHDKHLLEEAIGQFEFLRKEYPGSKYRVQALFTIAQIYKDDLNDNDKAKETLQEFLKRYPNSEEADDAKLALKEIDEPATAQAKKKGNAERAAKTVEKPAVKDAAAKVAETSKPDLKSAEVKAGDLKKVDLNDDGSGERHGRSMVTGVRHWSTPDYTRIAVDLEDEVKYSSDRIAHPNRIYFDLKDTRLSSVLQGKEFEVEDGYLKKIRIAQFAPGLTRVVLEVADDVSEYSAFLLPNPYRLVIDIHGKKPATLLAKNKTAPVTKESPKPAEVAKVQPAKAEVPKADVSKTDTAKTDVAKTVASAKKVEERVEAKTAAKSTELAKTDTAVDTVKTVAEVKPAVIESKPSEPVKKIVEADEPATEVMAKLTPPPKPEVKDEPPVRVRGKKRSAPDKLSVAKVHEAQPTSDGDRSLIRALGLKIGRIVIDAGHGGHDTGTIGPHGIREKDVVLDVALKLGRLLEDRLGAEVVYTRDDDTFIPLETRTAIANQQQADLFISIHANSSDDPSARGVETYYLNFTSSRDALEVAARENAVSEKSIHELQDLVKKIAMKEKIEESRELAVDIQQSLHGGLAAKAPAIRDRGVKKAPFIVLIGANMPSILAEISFISNPTDEKKLETSDYRQKIAESLYKGISKYVGGLSGIKVAAKMASEPGN